MSELDYLAGRLQKGAISRREFLGRAAALGASTIAISSALTTVEAFAARLGMTARHLNRLFARHWGASHDAAYRALRDNFCANVEGGAWILRQALDEAHGDLWKGVALYHSHDPVQKHEYMRLVYAQAMRLKLQSARELASADPNGGGR